MFVLLGGIANVPPPPDEAILALSVALNKDFSDISVECAYPIVSPSTVLTPKPSAALKLAFFNLLLSKIRVSLLLRSKYNSPSSAPFVRSLRAVKAFD